MPNQIYRFARNPLESGRWSAQNSSEREWRAEAFKALEAAEAAHFAAWKGSRADGAAAWAARWAASAAAVPAVGDVAPRDRDCAYSNW